MAQDGLKTVGATTRPIAQRPVAGAQQDATGMTVREVVAILRRHLLLIIAMVIVGFGCGAASWMLLLRFAPRYTAQTFIRVLPPVQDDPTRIQATIVAKDIQFGYRQSMAMLLKSQSTMQQLIDRDRIQQTQWFKDFGPIKDVRIRKAVRNLKKRLGAFPQRDGDSIVVTMTCREKKESALIVNEAVSLFISSQGGTKRKEVADRLSQLEERQVLVQRDLDSAERSLDDVRRRYGFTDLEEHAFQPVVDRKLSELETEQNKLVMDISQTRASMERLAVQAEGPVQVQVERQVETDPVMTLLAQQLALRESELAGAMARFGEDHKVVRQIREFIDAIQQERARRKGVIAEQTRQSNLRDAQDELVTLERRLEELERMREEAAKQKEELDLARAQYEQRVAIRDERRTMLDSMKEQIEKLKIIHDDPETPKVQFVDLAPEPLEASFPTWQVFFPGGTVLGLLAGLALAFLIELLNDLVRTPKDVANYLHIALLGMIPDAEEDDQVGDIELALAVGQAPNSITSESYRRVRTNLKLSSSGQTAGAILVTSGRAKDGTTTAAVNLAATLVADGKKVLLIDGNFRRPGVHKIFAAERKGAQAAAGLSTFLAGQCALQDAIRPSGMERLDIIESGPMPASPAEALGAPAMEQLIKQQRDNYDYVIVDGPPVLLASESKILAKYVDGTLLVFNAAVTRRGAAQRTISELRQVGAAVIGCVLLGVKTLKGGYFREMFRSYEEYQKLEPAKG